MLRRFAVIHLILIWAFPLSLAAQSPVNYDIVYVRAKRAGDTTRIALPEVKDPIQIEPGADLVLLHPDGSEEVLVVGGNGAVADPVVSFDGQWVYYAKFDDQRTATLNYQRRDASRAGADIFKINPKTRQVVQLTFQEWTPNTAAADWSDTHLSASAPNKYYLGYGIFNLGPCPLPGGRVMFTSSRNGFLPNKDYGRRKDFVCPLGGSGAPITSPDPARRNSGWFLDDLRPTLTLSSPRAGSSSQSLDVIRLGTFDYYSGLDRSSLSVKASFEIGGKAAGTELAPFFFETADHIWSMTVAPALD